LFFVFILCIYLIISSEFNPEEFEEYRFQNDVQCEVQIEVRRFDALPEEGRVD
jgi:hypothetical protein